MDLEARAHSKRGDDQSQYHGDKRGERRKIITNYNAQTCYYQYIRRSQSFTCTTNPFTMILILEHSWSLPCLSKGVGYIWSLLWHLVPGIRFNSNMLIYFILVLNFKAFSSNSLHNLHKLSTVQDKYILESRLRQPMFIYNKFYKILHYREKDNGMNETRLSKTVIL